MGRTPKPTKLKLVTGNPGRRPLNEREPQPLVGEPHMPEFLCEAAKAEWRRMAPILLRMGLLTIADGACLAGYCLAYADVQFAKSYIQEKGKLIEEPIQNRAGDVVGYKTKKNPAVAMLNESSKLMRQFLGDFGLSPAMRSKVQTNGSDEEGDELDDMLGDGEEAAGPGA